jgi:hypothetical protein
MPRSVAEALAEFDREAADVDREAAQLVAAETTKREAAVRRQRMARVGALPAVPGPYVVRDGRRMRVAGGAGPLDTQTGR